MSAEEISAQTESMRKEKLL